MPLTIIPLQDDVEDIRLEPGLASPMGGKHQRDLSLSAKWANNKALALEYLKRQREVLLWIESVLGRKLETRDLHEELKSGIVLREVMTKLYPEPPGPTECRSPISRRYSLRMAPWKERENISIFLKQCKALGMEDTFLFCTDDLYEGTNMVQVLFSVQHFMEVAQDKWTHLFKRISDENLTFSNQEVEMALSKIEQAGVEANALLTSAPPSASPSPGKADVDMDGQDPTYEDDPSTASSSEEDSDLAEPGNHEETNAAEDLADEISDEDQLAEALLDVAGDEGNNEVDGDSAKPEEPTEDQIEQALDALEIEQLEEEAKGSFLNPEVECDDVSVLVDESNDAEIEVAEFAILNEVVEELLANVEIAAAVEEAKEVESAIATANASEDFVEEKGPVVARAPSATHTELTDKHETFVGDSLGSTAVDVLPSTTEPAAAESKPTTRDARAAKKQKAKMTKARASSDEQLDAEAMSKCTCGGKCAIM